MIIELTQDFAAAIDGMPNDHPQVSTLTFLHSVLVRETSFIHRHREDYPQALTQSLYNSAKWRVNLDREACPVDQSTSPRSSLADILERWTRKIRSRGTPSTFLTANSSVAPLHIDPSQTPLGNHHGGVWCLSVHPAENLVASGGFDSIVNVWDYDTRTPVAILPGHRDGCRALKFTFDGKILVTTDCSGNATLWDTETWQIVHQLPRLPGQIHVTADFRHHTQTAARAWDCDVSPNEPTIAVCYPEHGVQIARITGQLTLQALPDTRGSVIARFSPDGSHLAVYIADPRNPRLMFWSVNDLAAPIQEHPLSCIESLAWTSDGTAVACGRSENLVEGVRIVSMSPSVPERDIPSVCGTVWSISASISRDMYALGDSTGAIELWNGTLTQQQQQRISHVDKVTCVCFDSSGRRVISGSDDGTIQVWDLNHSIRWAPRQQARAVGTACWCDRDLTVLFGEHETVSQWSLDTDSIHVVNRRFDGTTSALSAAIDRTLYAVGTKKGCVCVFDPLLGPDPIAKWNLTTSTITSIAFCAKRSRIAVGCENGTAYVLNYSSLSQEYCWEPQQVRGNILGAILDISFSRDGTLVATAAFDGLVQVVDILADTENGTPHFVWSHATPLTPEHKWQLMFERRSPLMATRVKFASSGTRIAARLQNEGISHTFVWNYSQAFLDKVKCWWWSMRTAKWPFIFNALERVSSECDPREVAEFTGKATHLCYSGLGETWVVRAEGRNRSIVAIWPREIFEITRAPRGEAWLGKRGYEVVALRLFDALESTID